MEEYNGALHFCCFVHWYGQDNNTPLETQWLVDNGKRKPQVVNYVTEQKRLSTAWTAKFPGKAPARLTSAGRQTLCCHKHAVTSTVSQCNEHATVQHLSTQLGAEVCLGPFIAGILHATHAYSYSCTDWTGHWSNISTQISYSVECHTAIIIYT